MVKAVLFDFDGTLADSSPGIFHTALYTVRKLGIEREYTDEELRRFIGPPLRMCFSVAFGLEEALLDPAVAIYREEYRRKGMHMMSLYPGMEKLLAELKAKGIKICVWINPYIGQEAKIFAEGMEKIYKQLMTTLESIGVKAIEAVGKEFNPDFHNAVMHVEDEEFGENIVAEEFQKGYTYRDSVVRHSMVKVAN